MWDVLTTEEKNKVLLKMLVQASKADMNMSKNEFAYLLHVCHQLSLEPELIREYASAPSDSKEILPSSEEERMQILYHLLFVMKADETIQPEEEVTLFELAFRLGFSESMTRDFIDVLKSSPMSTIPTKELLDIIRKYLN